MMIAIKEPFNILVCLAAAAIGVAWLGGAILCALVSETFSRLFEGRP